MSLLFVPDPYREPDGSWTVELVRSSPLAVLACNGAADDVPFATHLPVIPDPVTTPDDLAELPGATLLGHMNRANPHWAALEDGMPVLAIFSGAHSYVSPTLYAISPAAPTWNFTSVHVRGTLRRIEPDIAGEETLGVVQATVRAFEARFGTGWDMTDSVDYFRKIVPAVGAFRIEVTAAQGMFKLSQEQHPEVSARVREAFAAGTGLSREVASLMERLPSAAPSCPHSA